MPTRFAALGPEPLTRALTTTPELINYAAEHRSAAAVRLLTELDFDVNHLLHCTPLHEAVWNDDVETVRTLIELGADPRIKDTEHDSSALGWAQFGGTRQVEAILRGLTP
ncbi:hypothetical protein GCM10010293_49500 [Streptomyces griseoflavus]|uniref:ankyrin repeat domain-containing protein n=1 Tax=Streptomyces griseoflavus TaxID=35619 RepID=UPI00167C6851|nr:ankyrin repeat domain-containing protein [Streptomyces griseoflavus]GGV43089.1 hypothetical protein GCM10010293_49500 [Streptomyces griseoflavus]